MSARGKARFRAVQIMYEAEAREMTPGAVVTDRAARLLDTDEPPVTEYAHVLIEGVAAHRERIDELLTTYAEGWTLERMPAVDRNALRIGAFELLFCDDVPDAVAVSEAVALVAELSTDESPRFVNGLLARLAELKPELTAG
jgi:N utilization substance protein B